MTDKNASTIVVDRSSHASISIDSDARFVPGTILGDRYRVVSMLGRGGMGEVYRADDLRLGQTVALKFLPAARALDTAGLYREARAGRAVADPNVCRLYDVVEVDEHVFLSMEYVDGEDLASLLRRIGRFSPDKALAVARDLCAGLAAIHDEHLVHADLKPANIMLDGRGRARITDFGLAALAADSSRKGVLAGTPRYMAPEQFRGAPASVASDIYALGLVMAEVFTGEAVIAGGTISEIAEQHNRAYEIAVAPHVDDVIRACLDPDPGQRPKSADEVLQRLPPRDPLAAAVAAGETPSPGMILEAEDTGELSRRAAWLSLASTLGATLLVAFVASKTMFYAWQPVQPPDALESRARALIARFAPDTVMRDTASWVSIDREPELITEGVSTTPTEVREGRLYFHFRSAPEPLAARNAEFRVLDDDPPLNAEGMTRVVLDEEGRLIEFAVVPSRGLGDSTTRPDFRPLLDETGFSHLTPAPPRIAAPFDTDAKFAWQSERAFLEGASFNGRPVWLAVIRAGSPKRQPSSLATTINILLLLTVPIAVTLLALRNIRRGHGDLRGAMKLGLFVGASSLVTAVLRADHAMSLQHEWVVLAQMTAQAAFIGALVWGGYVAAEPLVRKRWPRMMIGWSRLLAGRWRDAMIGRELLAGVCGALAILLAWHATALFASMQPLALAVTPLGSARHVGYYLARALGESVLRALGAAVLLLLFRIIARQRILVAALTIAVIALSFLADTPAAPFARIGYALFAAAIVFVLLTRFGVLAVAVAAYCLIVMRTLPITLDVSQWYFGRGALALGVVIAFAMCGFFASLGTKRALPEGLVED